MFRTLGRHLHPLVCVCHKVPSNTICFSENKLQQQRDGFTNHMQHKLFKLKKHMNLTYNTLKTTPCYANMLSKCCDVPPAFLSRTMLHHALVQPFRKLN